MLSEYDWGLTNWCLPHLLADEWNPWPPSLCRAVLNSTRADALDTWAAARNNPAHNRQAYYFAADVRAPRMDGRTFCMFSHTRLADAWPGRLTRGQSDRWDLHSAIGADRSVLTRAWCVLKRRYWLVGALGNGRGVDDLLAIFRHRIGLPALPTARGREQASTEASRDSAGVAALSALTGGTRLRGVGAGVGRGGGHRGGAQHGHGTGVARAMASGGGADVSSYRSQHQSGAAHGMEQLERSSLLAIARRNQLDVALYEAARLEFELALQPLEGARQAADEQLRTQTRQRRRSAIAAYERQAAEEAAQNEKMQHNLKLAAVCGLVVAVIVVVAGYSTLPRMDDSYPYERSESPRHALEREAWDSRDEAGACIEPGPERTLRRKAV